MSNRNHHSDLPPGILDKIMMAFTVVVIIAVVVSIVMGIITMME